MTHTWALARVTGDAVCLGGARCIMIIELNASHANADELPTRTSIGMT